MRTLFVMTVVLAILCSVFPANPGWAEQGAGWRERSPAQGKDADAEARLVKEDVAAEIEFGREVAARIIGRYGLYQNTAVTKYVNLVGRVVAMSANRPELEFRFGVLNTDQVNAYAAPGGYVFVTRGALAKMQDEAELATVLAHEVAHVAQRHVVKELNIKGADGSAASGLARLIGGGTDSARVAFSQTVDKALDILFKDGYKREDEMQADQNAVILSAAAGYDPAGLVRYFTRLNASKGKQTEILDKTHPAYDARITALTEAMNSEGVKGDSLKNEKERFATVQKQF